jgi:hypothetical protein
VLDAGELPCCDEDGALLPIEDASRQRAEVAGRGQSVRPLESFERLEVFDAEVKILSWAGDRRAEGRSRCPLP